jgi:hypothetical protein
MCLSLCKLQKTLLKIETKIEKESWNSKVNCNSDMADYREKIYCSTGLLIYLLILSVFWRSKI